MKAATGPNRQQQVSSATKAYPAALAETKCREVLQSKLPEVKVQYSSGRLASKSKWWDELQQQGGWMARLCGHPAFISDASLDDIYTYGQRFYVHHPLVMFNHLLSGAPKCPKCLREGLEGAGLAQGTHRVLGCEEDFRVLHMKARCKGCPQHSAQDYVFSTMHPDFMALNFEAVVLEHVPWAYTSHKSGVTWELADRIARARSTGKAISEFAAHRNEAVVKRAAQLEFLYQTQLYRKQRRQGTLVHELSKTVGAAAPAAAVETAAATAPRPKQSLLASFFPKRPAAAVAAAAADKDASRGDSSSRDDGGSDISSLPAPGPWKGPWDPAGFDYQRLDPALATAAYKAVGMGRWQLQSLLQASERTEGVLALDHVMEVAKRMQGSFKGMLMACGASGNIVGHWKVYSTSLDEVRTQLLALYAKEDDRGEPIELVYVDDPRSMAGVLGGIFTGAVVKMDVGHIIFSRIGPLLDKLHEQYPAAIKDLAMVFFKFNVKQLADAVRVYKEKNKEYANWSVDALVKKLPLKTWQNTVERVYLPADEQVARLDGWLNKYVYTAAIFTDANGRLLVSGGQEGLDKFQRVFGHQKDLTRDGFLSDPSGREMYYHLGPNSDGLEVVRAMRGSPKVEVANRVAEHALATTGKMTEEMADGVMSDRVAGYNYNIKLELALAADKKAGGPLADAARLYRDFRDMPLGFKINDVCRSIGAAPSIPCMDIDGLEAMVNPDRTKAAKAEADKAAAAADAEAEAGPDPHACADREWDLEAEFQAAAAYAAPPHAPTAAAGDRTQTESAAAAAAAGGGGMAGHESAAAAAAAAAAGPEGARTAKHPGRKRSHAELPKVTDADSADEDEEAAAEWAAAHPHPTGQRRTASLGVAATIRLQTDGEGADTEPPTKKQRSGAAGHSKAGAAAAAAAAPAAAAARGGHAGAHKGAHTRKGHAQPHSHAHPQHHTKGDHTQRWMPDWVEQRVQQGRELVYTDYLGPVETSDDAEMFTVVVQEQQQRSGHAQVDWVAAARAFNEAVVANLTHNGGRNLTFKHPSHLKAYNKHLVHTVSQAHAAGVQAAVEAASDPQQQQLDLEEVLGTILRECVQHAGSFQDLPPGLQALANAVRRELPAGDNAAAAAEDGANRDVIGAATLDMSPPAAAAAAGAATVGTSAAKAGSRSASKAAASSALAATATAGDGRANRQAAVAAGVAAAGGGDGAGSMSAAAAAAAAGGGTGSSRLPSGGLGAFAALRQPPPGGHSSKKSSKATAAGYGKGKGGKGGSKVCVPCTQLKRSGDGAKLTVAAAKVHPAAVVMDGDHQKAPEQDGCPFCKCSVCKKQWGDKQVQPADYTKAVACPKNRHYKPKRS